ncbi:MAG: 30S ribosomal protein S17e [Promethearchaeota archaeon]
MGKIRPSHIKNISKKILETYGHLIEDDFEKNKEILDQILDLQSKRLRNRIAGYLTSLVRIQKSSQYFEPNNSL